MSDIASSGGSEVRAEMDVAGILALFRTQTADRAEIQARSLPMVFVESGLPLRLWCQAREAQLGMTEAHPHPLPRI